MLSSVQQARIEEQGRWLDREMEALVEQRKAAEKLDKVTLHTVLLWIHGASWAKLNFGYLFD